MFDHYFFSIILLLYDGVKMINSNNEVKKQILSLYDMLVGHEGYGEIKVNFKIIKKDRKEIIIHCGKQYRYVIDVNEEK